MVTIIIVGLIEALLICGAIFFLQKKQGDGSGSEVTQLTDELKVRSDLLTQIQGIYSQMVGWEDLRERAKEINVLRDALKLERGRVTITQAELETVEARLRELDEIDREIQASGLETKEELRILNKKEKDLSSKNETLKAQIQESLAKIEQLISEVEMSAQMLAHVDAMKTELIQTEQRIDSLLLQIEGGNEQYFVLKHTYDALDIEYAQLYEKFSEAEAAVSSGQK